MAEDFTRVMLPHVGKRVLRLGVAGNYGLQEDDLVHAAERGVGFWMYNPRYGHISGALRRILAAGHERHVVAALGVVAYAGGMVRRLAESSLRSLGIDRLDLLLLPWLGRASFLTSGVQDTVVRLKEEGKIRAVGTSIHDRTRAGRLAQDSVLDALMIRYNAKHPGAEQDIFPLLDARNPLIVAYTATSWRQLLRPVPSLQMPPWPGAPGEPTPPPPLTAALCYRFCLMSPRVHVTWTAPKTREQLDANLDALEAGPLSESQYAWVREYGQKLKAKSWGWLG